MTLETALLKVLHNVHPLLLTEAAAQMDVNCLLPAPAGLAEVRAGLRELERGRRAVSAPGSDGRPRWKIAAPGLALLAEREQGM